MRPIPLALYLFALLASRLVLAEEYIESRALNLCSNSLEFTATYFNVRFTPRNRTIALSFNGRSSISGKVVAELIITVYGYTAMTKVLNPCDMDLEGLCPVRAGELPVMNTNIKVPDSVISQIPGIAYTVPDLDASVRVFINSSDTGRSITCLEAELSNGKTVYQPGVGWTTAIISGLGLAASAVTSALGHSKAATHIATNVISLFGFMQSQAMFGMSSVHMPPIAQSWTQNFQWSMGLVRVGFLETLCTWYQRSTGGKPSTLIVDHSKKSIQVLKKRSYDTLRKRTVKSGADTHKSIVIRGIQRVGYKAGIEVTNIFLTGLIFFVFFATLAMICVAIARVIHKSLVRSGKIKDDEVKWNFIMKGILFRVILLGYPQICILCLWEFTQHDSSAEAILASVMLLTTTVAIGFATQKVARLAKQSVKLHRNPAYILYTDPACLNKWGFLYVQYQAKAYWFIIPALVYIIVKSMFISLSQAAPVVQTIALVIIETSMLISVSILRPWMNKKTDIYNISIAAINFVNAVFLLIFSNVFSQPGILTGVMGVVFFAYNAVFSLVLLVLVLIASIYAVVSKNPDIRYQPMRDDRESFIRSQSQHQLGTELDALGAAARGDKHSTHDNSTPSLVDPLDRREHYNEETSEDTLEEGQPSAGLSSNRGVRHRNSPLYHCRRGVPRGHRPYKPPANLDVILPIDTDRPDDGSSPWKRGAGYE
ncbi:hypothetical protein BDV37DRAFT_292375 [Aspergillus pseudonomiae]|uniref:ML-like domain-containing protein n=1 Tax=Aspergillus pseudonomiae TaxID=1506151 RepID=A0A5N7DI74_9EURO|nr:uncharacterized protein BDV37DRAFT_292375 [Aspergillus pseudonomiae]KAE8406140.1 hypothetical protein BDV37DRAFT_292375 [Aspergillus pseudonomiae]